MPFEPLADFGLRANNDDQCSIGLHSLVPLVLTCTAMTCHATYIVANTHIPFVLIWREGVPLEQLLPAKHFSADPTARSL